MKHYKPGMKATRSGIYEAAHGASHRLQHEVTISAGTIFPVCRQCGIEVKFRLLQRVKNAEQGWVPFGILFEPYSRRTHSALKPQVAWARASDDRILSGGWCLPQSHTHQELSVTGVHVNQSVDAMVDGW
jgi:hypothetical protein